MASFKTMQDLFLSHTSNFIDNEEFLVLSDLFEWKNPCFPYEDHSTFNLDEMTESECLSEFRFRKKAILADVLGIPETIRCEQGSTCDGLEQFVWSFTLVRKKFRVSRVKYLKVQFYHCQCLSGQKWDMSEEK